MCLSLTACSTTPEFDLTIHESDRGAVYLERMADRSFQAAHPIQINIGVLARILTGIRVHDQQGILQEMLAGRAEEYRAFSDEDVSYLAPLLSEALSHAASDQQVAFRVTQTTDSGSPKALSSENNTKASSFSTGGSLYVHERLLYVTLSHYRRQIESATTTEPQRGFPDTTGLAQRIVTFSPEDARRHDQYRDARATSATLVIDYDRLASLPPSPSAAPVEEAIPTSAPGSTDLRSTQPRDTGSTRRDAEIEALRKELQDIKRRLAEQEADRSPQLKP
jgi:hypothetical protein